jgi:hypothetical protein
MTRDLCAPCIADVMNNPYDFTIGEIPTGAQRVTDTAAALEGYYQEGETVPIRDRRNGDRIMLMVAITVISGVPHCTYHASFRNWQYPPRR